MSHTANVDRFESIAAEYDDFISRVVPHYVEQNRLMMELLPFDRDASFHALELGVGSGSIAHAILEAYPHATVHGIDIGEKMLGESQQRLESYGERYTSELADICTYAIPPDTYDLVIGGLSVHHLDDTAKQELTKCVFKALRPGGMYMLREIVLADSPQL